jgi:hypothetical protein
MVDPYIVYDVDHWGFREVELVEKHTHLNRDPKTNKEKKQIENMD